jgi:hypothetical protein
MRTGVQTPVPQKKKKKDKAGFWDNRKFPYDTGVLLVGFYNSFYLLLLIPAKIVIAFPH